jgi:fatty acid desaturase
MIFNGATLKGMQQQARQRFVIKLLIYSCGLGVPMVAGLIYGFNIALQCVMAVFLAHGTQLTHQLTHVVFSNSKDRFIGWWLGVALFENFIEYRVSHLHHHRFIGSEKYHCHPSRMPKVKGLVKLVYNLLHLFKIVFYVKTAKRLLAALVGHSDIATNDKQKRMICQDYRWMILAYTGVLTAAYYFAFLPLLVDIWLIPLVIASCLHTLLELATHAQCAMDETDPALNSRSIRTNGLMNWFSNYCCYHAEHHQYMAVPVDALPQIHAQMPMDIKHTNPGYLALVLQLLKGKKTQNPSIEPQDQPR